MDVHDPRSTLSHRSRVSDLFSYHPAIWHNRFPRHDHLMVLAVVFVVASRGGGGKDQ